MGPARSGRPDDKLREAIQGGAGENLDRFVAAAPGDDENAYFHLASPGEVARAAQAAKGDTGIGAKSRHSPVARPATRHGKTRAQTRRGNNDARRAHCCNAVARATVAHPTVKQMSSFWNLYDMGP